MKLRDYLFGAISTLVITILAGIIIYYLTKEPPQLQLEELNYEDSTPFEFDLTKSKLSFYYLKIWNEGKKEAKNVHANIEFPSYAKILEYKITISTGNVGNYKSNILNNNTLEIIIENLVPTEIITTNIMIDGELFKKPTISIKCDTSIGKYALKNTKDISFDKFAMKENVFEIYLKIIFIILIIFSLLLLTMPLIQILKPKKQNYAIDLNNTGFLLLHKRFNKEAKDIFEKEIHTTGGSSYVLSNYALCLALEGEKQISEKYFEAALFIADSNRKKILYNFNRLLALLSYGNEEAALDIFNDIYKDNEKFIKPLVLYSDLIKDYTIQFNKFKKVIDNIIKN